MFETTKQQFYLDNTMQISFERHSQIIAFPVNIANLRYPAKNDKFFAGERRYSH